MLPTAQLHLASLHFFIKISKIQKIRCTLTKGLFKDHRFVCCRTLLQFNRRPWGRHMGSRGRGGGKEVWIPTHTVFERNRHWFVWRNVVSIQSPMQAMGVDLGSGILGWGLQPPSCCLFWYHVNNLFYENLSCTLPFFLQTTGIFPTVVKWVMKTFHWLIVFWSSLIPMFSVWKQTRG